MEPKIKTIGQYFNLKMITSFGIGIIVGVFFAIPLLEREVLGTDFLANVFERDDVTVEEAEPIHESVSEFSSIASDDNLLVASDQPAGLVVVMSMVSLSKSSWVAIHESNADGVPGNILGARRFEAGQYFGSTIELLRGMQTGTTYHALLHFDDGDSFFDYEKEVPIKDPLGKFITTEFIATSA